ncbi:MAG: nucleotidyltransferase domain-containing protein [Bryobacterales bacterium]
MSLRRFDPAGLLAVFLYGSVQSDRQREDSDVDIAVLDLPMRRLSWADQAVIAGELERSIGRPVDLRMLRDCPLSLQAHVLREGLLFGSAMGERSRNIERQSSISTSGIDLRASAGGIGCSALSQNES